MFHSLWNAIKWVGVKLQSPLLLIIRLYWGYQFLITGFGKFLNLHSVAEYFQTLNIPFPYPSVVLAAGTEFIGGALLILGLFSRVIAIPLLILLFMAYFTAGHDSLISLFTEFDPEPFFRETPFLFAYATLLIFCFGPGKFSADYFVSGAYKNKEMP